MTPINTTFHDYSKTPARVMHVLRDGRIQVARARWVWSMRKYVMKAHGMSWLDPRAREPNVFGVVDPQYMLMNTREARDTLRALCELPKGR